MSIAALEEQKGKVAREGLIGRLMWFSVPEATILDYKTVVAAMEKSGLNRPLPGFPADHDVYRRVTTAAQMKHVPHNGHPDQFENWLVRDVASRGEDILTRRIVCEVVDPKGRRLDYAQVADIEFHRPVNTDRTAEYNARLTLIDAQINVLKPSQNSRRKQLVEQRLNVILKRDSQPPRREARLNFVWLDGHNEVEYPTAKDIMAEVAVQFSKWKGKVHDAVIRLWIRHTILDMGATPVRPSGGIYFLEERYADQVEALEKFCAEVLPQGGECHSVEIPDNDKQREMIRRAIENETTGAIERKMAEIAEIRKAGRLSADKYTEMLMEISELEKKVKGYAGLLERDLSEVESRLELLAMQTKRLAPYRKKRGDE